MKVVEAHAVKQKVLKYAFFERGHIAAVTEGLNNADVLSIDKGRAAVEFEIKVSRSDLQKELLAIKYGRGFANTTGQAARKQMSLDIGVPKKAGGWSKVSKHEEYIDPENYFKRNACRYSYEQYLPNYFYLVVPEKLVQLALDGVSGTKYGVIAFDGCRQLDKHFGWIADGVYFTNIEQAPENARRTNLVPCAVNGGCYQEIAVRKAARSLHDRKVSQTVLDEILKRAVAENIRLLDEVVRLDAHVARLQEAST